MKKILIIAGALVLLLGVLWLVFFLVNKKTETENKSDIKINDEIGETPTDNIKKPSEETSTADKKNYPLHENITVTFFWIGESASQDNEFISNAQSAWDGQWQKHFGGIDDPENRNGFWPKDFEPKENPFYCALPYNDFEENGQRKNEAAQIVYWANEKTWGKKESMLKNRWVKIIKNGKNVYAQWEDSGPFVYDDKNYVFGNNKPKNTVNASAGIDVSPAVRDYLDLKDIDKVDWQFVSISDVPDGPWKKIITSL